MNDQTHGTAGDFSNDEISITDLIMKLWQRRGLIVVLPIIFLLLAVTFLFFTAVKTQSPTTFFIQLQGINKSSYPNGSSFSPQDLLIPEVLTAAASQLNLPVDNALRKAIQVEYGVPTTVGIQKKYQVKLADKKLTAIDIETINNAYQSELQQVSESGLRITINHSALGLSSAQGAVLANALPRAWTEVFTQKYRVLVDSRLDNVSVVIRENPLVTTSDILSARISLNRINSGLNILGADNRLKAIVSDGGFNSSDLQSQLQNFQELYFRAIFSGLFLEPDFAARAFKAEIGLKITELNSNIEELNRTLVDLKSFRAPTFSNQSPNVTNDAIQFGDSSLNQVVELANQASLTEYLRKVLDSRRDLIEKKSSLRLELDRAEIEMMDGNNDKFISSASQHFSILKNEYVSLLQSVRKIRRQAYGDFYQPLGAPDVVGSRIPPKSALVLLLSLMLGGMLAIMIALVLPACRKSV
jgi:hypothetical protein